MAASAPSPSPSASPSPPPKKPNNKQLPPPPPSVPASWSHLETIQLIDAYQEKWYSLNRGQLKAHQWEEVAASVAARCGSDPPTKTSTQCRHKIEKLRKRYRSDKHRPSASTWPYFDRMDLMERGPTDPPRTSATTTDNDDDDDDDEDDDDHPAGAANNTRSINHILRRPQPPPMLSLLGKSFPRFSRSPRFRKRSSFEEEEEEDPMSELASVVRSFGEGFVRMEKMKMEMMREVERNRMEMEMKRTEMILKSQQRIADAIADAFGSQKKAKKSNEMSN